MLGPSKEISISTATPSGASARNDIENNEIPSERFFSQKRLLTEIRSIVSMEPERQWELEIQRVVHFSDISDNSWAAVVIYPE
jgi:hypothetical protein